MTGEANRAAQNRLREARIIAPAIISDPVMAPLSGVETVRSVRLPFRAEALVLSEGFTLLLGAEHGTYSSDTTGKLAGEG